MKLDWKRIASETVGNIIAGVIGLIGIKAVETIIDESDLFEQKPEKVKFDKKGNIVLDSDDYKIV